ncbi:MAG: hypothetical protein ACYTFY_07400 [Planctomycetota bacterium]|jgi:hypothetical protein
MPKEVMDRNAADNEYLHPDFHGALSASLIYVKKNFGNESVKEYVRKFAHKYHKKLIEKIKSEGITALKKHYTELYKTEKGQVSFEEKENELIMKVPECPAVTHMRKSNYEVADCWVETESAYNEALCEGSKYSYEMVEYNAENGASIQRFYIKGDK